MEEKTDLTKGAQIDSNSPGPEKQKHKVTFLPSGKIVETDEEKSILDIALENQIDIEHNCGGNCACATCHIFVKEGMEFLSEISEEEEDQLEEADNLSPNSRLACQSLVRGDVVVEISKLV